MVINLLVLSLACYFVAVFSFEHPEGVIRAKTDASIAGPPLHRQKSLKTPSFYPKETDRIISLPEMKQNWKKSQDELQYLKKDFNELSDMYLALREKFQSVPLKAKEFSIFLSDLLDIDISLQNYQNTLALSTKWRIFELGKTNLPKSNLNLLKFLESSNDPSLNNPMVKFSNLPEEIVEKIAHRARKNVWDTLFHHFKQLLTIRGEFFDSLISWNNSEPKKIFLLFWKYTFTSADFLLKNEMADPSIIRNFFQDTEIIKQVIVYVEHNFRGAIENSASFGSYQLTKHWYWPLLHNSFKALSTKEEEMFNAHILLDFRFKKIRENLKQSAQMQPKPGTGWMRDLYPFFRSFDAQKYLEEFKATQDGKSNYDKELRKSSTTEMINKDVEELIKLIVISSHQYQNFRNYEKSQVLIYFCDVLHFIDQYISPGIINRSSFEHTIYDDFHRIKYSISSKHPNYDDFDKRYNMIRLDFKGAHLESDATRYYSYIKTHNPADWSKTKLYKSNFDAYLNQLVETFREFKTEYSRLIVKLPDLPARKNFEDHRELMAIEDRFEHAVRHLSIKSSTFST